jgi:Kef-type K+ transport system membrane component KefB
VSDFFFLPDWPFRLEQFPWFAVLGLIAVGAGECAQRFLKLPRLLGWVAAGILLGPSGFGFFSAEMLRGLRGVVDIAVALVLFELGQRVDLSWLRRNPWLLATSAAEASLSFLAVFAILWLANAGLLVAAVAAAIAMGTSPAVSLVLTKDLRAQGQVTERILLLTTLNCIYAVIAVSMLFAWLHAEYRGGWVTVVSHPLYILVGSLALAAAFSAGTQTLLRLLGRRVDAQFICVLALIVIAVAVAEVLNLSVVLTLLAFGTMARHFDRERRFVSMDFGRIGQIFVILFFALLAAELDLRVLPAGLLAGAGLVAARYLGKTLGVMLFARQSGIGLRKASLVGLGLMPMSGIAVLLMYDAAAIYPEFGPSLATVVVSAIAILEVLGPLLAQFALQRAGDTHGSK